jgi:transcriptional regulator with XRE-family HTH domain
MNKNTMLEVGSRIKAVRKHLQISQKGFAGHLEIPTAQLSAMETGSITPDFDFLYKVEKIFKVNLSYIISGKGSVHPLWERPTMKMCEDLLKDNGQEFRELIDNMHRSREVCIEVLSYFFIYMIQKGHWKSIDELRANLEKKRDDEKK